MFIARTPEDFLELTRARIPDPETGQPDPEKLGAYVTEHPEFAAALQKGLPKIAPTISYVTSDYRALHAFGLVDADGGTLGPLHLGAGRGGQISDRGRAGGGLARYLQEEIRERLAAGTATMHLDFALAHDDDPLDDPTAEWEGDRELVRLGTPRSPR